MIDDRTVAAALERLAVVAPAHWPAARAEVQDGGTFLLLSVQLAATDGAKVSASERDSITRQLNAVVPSFPEQTLGSWMLVVMRGADVEESILPNGV